jgi:hypothetical protein
MLDDLLTYCQSNDRVCPKPNSWHELWQMLPARQGPEGWEPALPLILAAWYETPAMLKMIRLAEHLRYAEANGVLPEVEHYVRSLDESEWAHLGEI